MSGIHLTTVRLNMTNESKTENQSHHIRYVHTFYRSYIPSQDGFLKVTINFKIHNVLYLLKQTFVSLSATHNFTRIELIILGSICDDNFH
jgi:hypothetical protein